MIVKSKCSECGHDVEAVASPGWIQSGSIPSKCSNCGSVVMIKANVDTETGCIGEAFQHTPETVLPIGSRVIIANEDHDLHSWCGTIIDKDYLHYRVQFDSGDSVWVPYTWVKKKEFQG